MCSSPIEEKTLNQMDDSMTLSGIRLLLLMLTILFNAVTFYGSVEQPGLIAALKACVAALGPQRHGRAISLKEHPFWASRTGLLERFQYWELQSGVWTSVAGGHKIAIDTEKQKFSLLTITGLEREDMVKKLRFLAWVINDDELFIHGEQNGVIAPKTIIDDREIQVLNLSFTNDAADFADIFFSGKSPPELKSPIEPRSPELKSVLEGWFKNLDQTDYKGFWPILDVEIINLK